MAEPYRLVATGRRWYLLAWDVDRGDCRTFRLDRMEGVTATGWRFRPREAPDAAEYVRRAIRQTPYPYLARVLIEAPKALVEKRIPIGVGTVTAKGRGRCLFEAGGHDLDAMATHLGALPWELTVLEPPGLREAMARQAERLTRAARMEP